VGWIPPPHTAAARRARSTTAPTDSLLPTLDSDDLEHLNKPPSLFDSPYMTAEENEYNFARLLQGLGGSWYRSLPAPDPYYVPALPY